MPNRHYVDAGHEPWARATVKRRAPLTQEQAEDLIATIDHLRGLLDQQDGQLRALMVQRADALKVCDERYFLAQGLAHAVFVDDVRATLGSRPTDVLTPIGRTDTPEETP